jgi:hypothetical protein
MDLGGFVLSAAGMQPEAPDGGAKLRDVLRRLSTVIFASTRLQNHSIDGGKRSDCRWNVGGTSRQSGCNLVQSSFLEAACQVLDQSGSSMSVICDAKRFLLGGTVGVAPFSMNESFRYATRMLVPFGENLYLADGPAVPFFGIPYPTRMAVVRLATGKVWLWSPVALTSALADAVDAVGTVGYIVSPNKLHHLFLTEWKKRWPNARLCAPPGLAMKKREIHFDAELGDEPEEGWTSDIEQVLFRGSFALQEVVFFHRASRTAIFGDLIQRFAEAAATGFKGWMMRLGHIVGPEGSTPGDWRLSFWSRHPARVARQRILDWQPERLLIAHGECASSGATEIISNALRWI